MLYFIITCRYEAGLKIISDKRRKTLAAKKLVTAEANSLLYEGCEDVGEVNGQFEGDVVDRCVDIIMNDLF